MSAVRFAPKREQTPTHDLIERLAQEFSTPSPGEQEPLFIEQVQHSPAKNVHLYVIWQTWEHLTNLERSEIIMDAYEKSCGIEKALKVTLAMGLTRKEAKAMRLDWEIEE